MVGSRGRVPARSRPLGHARRGRGVARCAEIDGWGFGSRGAGYIFGGDVVAKVRAAPARAPWRHARVGVFVCLFVCMVMCVCVCVCVCACV